ncbi:PucR family transcriptional regulator [Virgisporangium aliadipatigenens]|uniref:PucR family transcriptional regulator n=1 Tax=Virgisporangium aliadipatigenens TaxID=741659 RepID=UPI001EF16FFE|nr:helix-turn-helix domain-containing protein [Virgisporangium aliadipatigenens]
MNQRPQASLGRVLDDLGATLLELLRGDADKAGEIGGVVIHDPLEEPAYPQRAIVLGVGVRDPDDTAALLRLVAEHQAAALILRAPVKLTGAVTTAVDETGVALLGLTRGATWTQLAAMLRALLGEGDVGEADSETIAGMPSGDLFALANAVAALLDAPVTIEDRSSRVLAFSGRQDEADPSRVETILGRQVPERFARLLAERGVFRDLYRSEEPVFVPPAPEKFDDFNVPRVAMAVRSGDEVLGSIWAAVREPLSADRTEALRDAARLVALHMLRIRAGADVERRLRTDLLSTALEGGAGAREALNRLGLADQPVVVLALGTRGALAVDADASVTTERQRLSDGLALHLSAIHPRCATALLGDVTYGLVPVMRDADGEERGLRIATEFLDRVGDRVRGVVGIGPVARDIAGLAASRAAADRALRVLRAGSAVRVARLSDVHVESLLLELRDIVATRGDGPTGAVAKLYAYDAKHHACLVDTLRAWLDAFGDVIAASAALYVHPNTFRYRLRRLAEVGGIDLTDPEARFAAMLQLRIVPPPRD